MSSDGFECFWKKAESAVIIDGDVGRFFSKIDVTTYVDFNGIERNLQVVDYGEEVERKNYAVIPDGDKWEGVLIGLRFECGEASE